MLLLANNLPPFVTRVGETAMTLGMLLLFTRLVRYRFRIWCNAPPSSGVPDPLSR
jgi:hypothetical protein